MRRRIHNARQQRFVVAFASVVALSAVPTPSGAQPYDPDQRFRITSWVDDLDFMSVNAILGGVAAGVARRLRGGSFTDAFLGGALGGMVVYGAKRVSVWRDGPYGLFGRELGAVGSSMVRNAGAGTDLFDELVLPVGPLRVFWPTRSPDDIRVRADVQELAWLTSGLANDRLSFDLARSFSSGSVVFTSTSNIVSHGAVVDGVTRGEMIVLNAWAEDFDGTFAHERVHVVQVDFLKTVVGYPLEDWAVTRLTSGRRFPVVRSLLPGGVHVIAQYALSGMWDRPSDLFEVEADFLQRR